MAKLEKGTVVISGGFDPLHAGHVRMIKAARKLGKRLIIILNNDNWLLAKKGYVFMRQNERREVLMEMAGVSKVVITSHRQNDEDTTVCRELDRIRPEIFANGGDRGVNNTPEDELCRSLGIQMAYNVGGRKIQSSSELVQKAKAV